MAKRAKASEPSEPEGEAGIVKVDEPVPMGNPPEEPAAEPEPAPAPVDPPISLPEEMRAETPPPAPPYVPPRASSAAPPGPSFVQRVGRFFMFLWRLLLLLIFLGLLSVILYLAVPWLYQRIIRPLEQNTAQVRELQSRQEQTAQDLADLQTRMEALESVQNQHDRSLTELDRRLNDIEKEVTARTESLETLEKMLSDLDGQNEAVSLELERQINLLKSMELLSRARLSMYQSNFGLAKQDVQIARDLLATIRPNSPHKLAAELDAVVLRLDLTLSNLPDFPVAASDDLDIAWQILLSGLPQPTPTMIETPTPTLVSTLSATPTALPTLTPTLVVTVSPTQAP